MAGLLSMTARRFVHVTIRGQVQGVGFRAFIERQALERALDGWVRNREDGSVEAVFAGASPAVDAMLEACRTGPTGAKIEGIDFREEDAAGLIPSSRPAGFFVMPTV
jgi:acylphosphatase